MSKPLRFFIAGIIQGSLADGMHPQAYRRSVARLLREAFPGADVFDPVEAYPDSLGYDPARAEAAFLDLMGRAGECDALIAFVPEASMGTAIELWNARRAGALTVTVSGLDRNWAVRFLSDCLLPDLPALEAFVGGGGLAESLRRKEEGLLPAPPGL